MIGVLLLVMLMAGWVFVGREEVVLLEANWDYTKDPSTVRTAAASSEDQLDIKLTTAYTVEIGCVG